MTAARIKRASNFTLQRAMGSRCSPLAAERNIRADDIMLPDPGHSRVVSATFRALGAFRALALKHLHECYFGDEQQEEAVVDELGHFVNAAKLIAQSVGLPLDAADIFPSGLKDIDEISEFFIANTLIKDSLHLRIGEHFGERAAFNFHLAQIISVSSLLASIFRFHGRYGAASSSSEGRGRT